MISLGFIKKEVHKLDSKIKEEDLAFKSAVILLSSLQVGPSADKVARYTRYSRDFVRKRARRLKKSEVWIRRGHKSDIVCNWFEKKHGSIAFWLDVLVAEGMVAKTKDDMYKAIKK